MVCIGVGDATRSQAGVVPSSCGNNLRSARSKQAQAGEPTVATLHAGRCCVAQDNSEQGIEDSCVEEHDESCWKASERGHQAVRSVRERVGERSTLQNHRCPRAPLYTPAQARRDHRADQCPQRHRASAETRHAICCGGARNKECIFGKTASRRRLVNGGRDRSPMTRL